MAIDPKLLEELRERRSVARKAGGEEKLAKRRAKGQMGARERLEFFFEEGYSLIPMSPPIYFR